MLEALQIAWGFAIIGTGFLWSLAGEKELGLILISTGVVLVGVVRK